MGDKVFTEEERIEIVLLHIEQKRTIKSLSEEFGVSASTIGRWLTRYRNGGMSINNND